LKGSKCPFCHICNRETARGKRKKRRAEMSSENILQVRKEAEERKAQVKGSSVTS